MTLKQYFPISVVVFIAVTLLIARLGIPVLPFALILLAGETLLGFEVEDHKASRFVKAILGRK
jgi:hypothetical protein